MKPTWLVVFKWYHPFPRTLTVRAEAANAGLAVNRAFRQWRKENPRKKVNAFGIEVTRL